SSDKLSHLLQHERGGHAATASANRGDNAERAVRVAAVLDFHDCSCASAGTEMRRRPQLLLEENAAAKNFGAAVRGEVLVEDTESEFTDERLVRIADDVAHLRQVRQLLRRALRITARDDDPGSRITRGD